MINPKEGQVKQWLKSAAVRRLLNISPGTLRYTKIGGMLYYKMEDITGLLEGGKH